MSADIHVIPGVERNDIGPTVPVAHVLERVAEKDLNTIIVLGYGRDGWYLASSSPDLDRNVGMLTRAVHDILHCEPNDFAAGDAPK